MDPNACLHLILDAIADADRDQLCDSLADLRGWLVRGGSMPDPVLWGVPAADRKGRPILPHAAIHGWSADEVAECISGLGAELCGRLWALVEPHDDGDMETPEPSDTRAWWAKLSQSDKAVINAAVADDEIYGTK